MSGPYKNQLF